MECALITSTIVSPARLDANWRAITAELDAPRPARLERLLRSVRLPGDITRIVVATPALRRAWYMSIGGAILVGLGAADEADRNSLFTLLTLAPMVPVLGVAMAYGPAADPMYEVQLATPMRGIRLVAVRATTVLAVSVLLIGLLAALSPVARPMAAAWLLPALALTSCSLAAMTVLPPRQAAGLVGVAWVIGVVIARAATAETLAAFGIVGQIVGLVVTVLSCVIVTVRRASFDRLEYAT